MRIQKQPSRGRGEYEIAETFNGIGPADLFDLEITVDLGPLGTHRTGVALMDRQGKRRLRRIDPGTGIQIHRQVHAALLLPKPIRDEETLEAGQPVIMRDRCLMQEMQLASVSVIENGVLMEPSTLEIGNGSGNEVEVSVPDRAARIRHVLDSRDEFPEPVATALGEIHVLLQDNGPIGTGLEHAVDNLMSVVADVAPDQEVEYADGTDVLVALEALLELNEAPPPAPPADLIPLDAIHPADIEVRRRENDRKLRWVNARGAASRRFSRNVKAAYKARCVMCGIHLPSGRDCRTPGVEAAHIFAWRDADLDVVPNGLCLCKLHHWAFDSYLLTIAPDETGGYSVVLTQSAVRAFAGNTEALALLSSVAGPIPAARLPTNPNHRPHPPWLRMRNEELGIEPAN